MARLGVAGQRAGGMARSGMAWLGGVRHGAAGQGVAFLTRRQNNRAPRVASRLWRRAGVVKVCSPGAGRFGAEFLRKGNKDA